MLHYLFFFWLNWNCLPGSSILHPTSKGLSLRLVLQDTIGVLQDGRQSTAVTHSSGVVLQTYVSLRGVYLSVGRTRIRYTRSICTSARPSVYAPGTLLRLWQPHYWFSPLKIPSGLSGGRTDDAGMQNPEGEGQAERGGRSPVSPAAHTLSCARFLGGPVGLSS